MDLDAASEGYTVFLYDCFGGGIGISRPAFERFDEIVTLGRDIVRACACAGGCWSCVALSRRPDGNAGLSKEGALELLDRVADAIDA